VRNAGRKKRRERMREKRAYWGLRLLIHSIILVGLLLLLYSLLSLCFTLFGFDGGDGDGGGGCGGIQISCS
jgi:hypothetical protein